ncbi:MAG: triose-phosphate isomerase [Dehalococcoidia bacterium]|nr:triose-phosphate isomerase [Dehalococcoidia bacterium]
MARPPIVGGNWKLHTNREQARTLLHALREALDGLPDVEVVVCPPAPWLGDAADLLAGSTLAVGAQHVYWEREGAFTGEVSAAMLAGIASYVIVGHSERRHRFGERDEDVNRKLHAVLATGLHSILAVGELRAEREAGRTAVVLRRQLWGAFRDIAAIPAGFVVAYEPVWAIGTGLAATPALAQDACAQVRAIVAERFDSATAEALRVQYGGSVTAENAHALASQPDIDGALVGGASLRAADFAAICRAVAAARA